MTTTLLLVAACLAAAGAPLAADDLVEQSRQFEVPQGIAVLPEAQYGLLRKAARQDDVQTRLQTLAAIERLKLDKLADVVQALAADDRVVVRAGVVEAAHAIDARGLAETFVQWLGATAPTTPAELDLIQLLDQTLRDWHVFEAGPIWLERAADDAAGDRLRISAMQGLVTFAGLDEALTARARAVFTDVLGDADEPLAVRFAAARSLGWFVQADLALAERLADGAMPERLMAAVMLGSAGLDGNQQARSLLRQLAVDNQPAIQAAALKPLLIAENPDDLSMELLQRVAVSPDPAVRVLATSGAALHAQPAAVDLAFDRLGDAHPAVREAAVATLTALAEHDPLTRRIARRLTETIEPMPGWDADRRARRWALAEAAIHLAGTLDHEPVAGAIVGLLDYERPEVAVAAVDALRRLDVAATRRPLIAHFTKLLDRVDVELDPQTKAEQQRIAREFARHRAQARAAAEAFGAWREPAADAVLLPLVADKQHPIGPVVRVGVIWALGQIHRGQAPRQLADQLVGRIRDYRDPNDPESTSVRLESAVALGWMEADAQLKAMQSMFEREGEFRDVRAALAWAIGRITGTAPTITVEPYETTDVFIRPLRR